MRRLERPQPLRRQLAEEVERAKARGDELGTLMAESLAGLDGKLPPDRPQLFEVGDVTFSSWLRRTDGDVVPDASLNEVVDLHQAGNFGKFGLAADLPEITPDVEFCPGAFDGLTRQALAIRDKVGTVLSRHWIDYRHRQWSGRVEVTIRTILMGDRTTTTILPVHQDIGAMEPGIPPVDDSPVASTFGPTERAPVMASGMGIR